MKEFVRPNDADEHRPRVALVMPRSVMTATHHHLLRVGKYEGRFNVAEIWDLDERLRNAAVKRLSASSRERRSDTRPNMGRRHLWDVVIRPFVPPLLVGLTGVQDSPILHIYMEQ